MSTQQMGPAPVLPRVLDETWTYAPAPAADAPLSPPAVVIKSPAAEVESAPSEVAVAYRHHVAQLSQGLQDFVLAQQALHERFLSMRKASLDVLVRAATVPTAAQTAVSAAPPAVEEPPIQPVEPDVEDDHAPTGPTFTRRQLEMHADGRITELFGSRFAAQEGRRRQVRMPAPPLLLADRVVGLRATPAEIVPGTIWTETDVRSDSWYLHDGYMPPGILIEAGNAILMLVSYAGVDLAAKGDRGFRLLGFDATFHGPLPAVGETLQVEIDLDGHAAQGDGLLIFFHQESRNGERAQLSVRNGVAGLFTDDELAQATGLPNRPQAHKVVEEPRLDPPVVATQRTALDRGQLEAFARGDVFACFGPGFERAQTHTLSPRIPSGPMLLQDRVTHLEQDGGPWGRGYVRAEFDIRPDLWFFAGHFKGDPCTPVTLMFDGCLQMMALFLASRGYSLERDGWRFQPVPEHTYRLQCGRQVVPTTQRVVTEVFVEEVIGGPNPTVYAEVLCTVDGVAAFQVRHAALELAPDWPLRTMPELVAKAASNPRPVAVVDGFRFDEAALLAAALGKPSDMFGTMYDRFDGPGRVPRIPAPPFLFMTRIDDLQGPIGVMKPGAKATVHFDIDPDAWYFAENGCRTMPFAVLLEAALQATGWLGFYVGSALAVSEEVAIRNLDGSGVLLSEILPDAGTLVTEVELTDVSITGSVIIQTFRVRCLVGGIPVYDLHTVFGFFPPAALATQAGLPTSDADLELLNRDSDFLVDLTTRPPRYFAEGRPELARPMLLMIDRVDGFWPGAGDAGLGQLRAVKDVDPDEWFFKAHFFQDPVQPGSLGLAAMIQALQVYMLETGMDDGIPHPRFESLATQSEMSWKYRGQVLPHHTAVHTTLEITQTGRDERGSYAMCTASLWVDGQRLYEAIGLGMRIVSGAPTGAEKLAVQTSIDPGRDTWVLDHRPTYTVPALAMMNMVDLLARGSTGTGPVTAIRDVRVRGWFLIDRVRQVRTECVDGVVRLLDELGEELARARVIHGSYRDKPAAVAPIDGPEEELPYEAGKLPHGPAYQLLQRLVMGRGASSSVLSAESAVPVGMLNPALLDAALHGIPHADMDAWGDSYSADKVAYPAFVPRMEFFGPTPTEGTVRCEVREKPFLGTPDYPVFAIQIIGDEVWCEIELVESCFPKGRLVAAEPAQRRDFMRDRLPVAGLRLSHEVDGATLLDDADVEGCDWLPGTIDTIYGASSPEDVAVREHVAAAHDLHPGRVLAQLPLTRADLSVSRADTRVRVEGDGRGHLDLTEVRDFWKSWFNRGPWPVEDLHYGVIERFMGRVVLQDPEGYRELSGRSVLYLANHQTCVESLIFSVVVSGLNHVPTVTLAKIEHRKTWLGQLIDLCFAYPGVADPKLMMFFDRDRKESLPQIIGELAEEMTGPGRSVMVHVEGTRSLSCRPPVQKMSGAFIDMALAVGVPIVPVRFVGGLPADPVDKRVEFPIGMGKQDIHLGRAIAPDELASQHYGARKQCVVEAINALGVANVREQPSPGDAAFAERVLAWQRRSGVSHEHAALRQVLAELPAPGEPVRRLLAARSAAQLSNDPSPEGRWLAELGRRLLG